METTQFNYVKHSGCYDVPAVAEFYRKEMNVPRNMAAPSDFCNIDSSQLVIPLALHSTAIEFMLFTIEYVI